MAAGRMGKADCRRKVQDKGQPPAPSMAASMSACSFCVRARAAITDW
jgi:hypothetical protein